MRGMYFHLRGCEWDGNVESPRHTWDVNWISPFGWSSSRSFTKWTQETTAGHEENNLRDVQWQCCPDRHPHAVAPMAQENDDGKWVGIRAFKTIAGIEHEHWIVRKTPGAVLLANTLHDFLDSLIFGKDYKWTDCRRYIFQDVERDDFEDIEGEFK